MVRLCRPKMELGMGIHLEVGEGGVEQGMGPRARGGGRRVLGIKSRALSLVRLESRKNDPQPLIEESHERCIIANRIFLLGA